MKIAQNVKNAVGRRMLRMESEPQRHRQGTNFHAAQRVALLYQDEDEPHFNKVKAFARFLKEEYGVKVVKALGYIDQVDKRLPIWQTQKLEFEYFTKSDLNWHQRPIQKVKAFVEDDFDMLIDLSNGDTLPLLFVMKTSHAKMKVGRKGSRSDRYSDFMINVGANASMDEFIRQITVYLSNPKLK
ncbi:MAG: hypothetical protein RLZZ77_1059 [Bacteroidota bacterium]|jgi:hypothetical protein